MNNLQIKQQLKEEWINFLCWKRLAEKGVCLENYFRPVAQKFAGERLSAENQREYDTLKQDYEMVVEVFNEESSGYKGKEK